MTPLLLRIGNKVVNLSTMTDCTIFPDKTPLELRIFFGHEDTGLYLYDEEARRAFSWICIYAKGPEETP
jgi:hypothetical protein